MRGCLPALLLLGCATAAAPTQPVAEEFCPVAHVVHAVRDPEGFGFRCETPAGVAEGPDVYFSASGWVDYGWREQGAKEGAWVRWNAEACDDEGRVYRADVEVARGPLREIRCPEGTHDHCVVNGVDYEHWCEGHTYRDEGVWRIGPYLRAHLGQVVLKGTLLESERTGSWLAWSRPRPSLDQLRTHQDAPPDEMIFFVHGVEVGRRPMEPDGP